MGGPFLAVLIWNPDPAIDSPMPDPQIARIRKEFEAKSPSLNERTRRHWAATKALSLGFGGISIVAEATCMSRVTIRRGMAELKSPRLRSLPPGRVIRRQGGGRPRGTVQDPGLQRVLEKLVKGRSPQKFRRPLDWSLESSRSLEKKLKHKTSYRTIATLLHKAGYSLRGKRQRGQGGTSPDRAAQFNRLNRRVSEFQAGRQPVIFIELKKKKAASLEALQDSSGWISVSIGQDTTDFALDTLRHWWTKVGRAQFPRAKRLLVVTASSGNGGAAELDFAARLKELGLEPVTKTEPCWLPRGTSKWSNTLEQWASSCSVDETRRSGPVTGLQAVIELIGRPGKRTR